MVKRRARSKRMLDEDITPFGGEADMGRSAGREFHPRYPNLRPPNSGTSGVLVDPYERPSGEDRWVGKGYEDVTLRERQRRKSERST